MRAQTTTRLALAALLAAGAAACSSATDPGTGKVSVHLVDIQGDYKQINLHIAKVEIQSSTGWMTLGTPDKTVDILTLTGGVIETLVDGVVLPAGSYGQLRLVLGEGNTVMTPDGVLHDLTVPSGMKSGVKLLSRFDLVAGSTHDVFIDFDGHKSIWLHPAGASGMYILRPVIHTVEKATSGSISGKLVGPVGEASVISPLPDALVTAQTLDAGGKATVAGEAHTGPDGSYVIGLLPLGHTYFIVSQPLSSGSVYLALASGPIDLTPASPTGTFNATCALAAGVGSAAGKVTPAATADDADLVLARQTLDAGGTPHAFIVQTVEPGVAGTVESYLMPQLPAGSYSLSAERRTMDMMGNETVATSPSVAASVVAAATATADLAF